jgi:alcohol dehydrogenase class IV
MINRFVLNEVSYFGPGAREVLPQEIKRLGLHKAFVATDKDLIKFGVADKVLKVLENAGIPYEIFSEIKPNPTVSNVKAGVEAFAKSGADFILAIGGGSSIDTSKAIGIITNNPDFSDVVSLEGVAPTRKKSVPIIALPTTAGTAAEVTINYVITDEENHKKMVCVDPNDIPAIAIVDAELMYTLPKGHGIELAVAQLQFRFLFGRKPITLATLQLRLQLGKQLLVLQWRAVYFLFHLGTKITATARRVGQQILMITGSYKRSHAGQVTVG